ncbi:MAG: putative DCC family thiol-disulfide oxidoreductase YuxK [Planctomycetota bacterium]|jgi:predicted DCC family thiol-disulfide oxidoreductase YuxK
MKSGGEDDEVVILFDGPCALCNGFVGFLEARNASGGMTFASLQSELGKRLLEESGLSEVPGLDSVVVLADGESFTHSAAILRIAKGLGPGWRALGGVGWCVPRGVRDFLYRWVAGRRSAWFGRG